MEFGAVQGCGGREVGREEDKGVAPCPASPSTFPRFLLRSSVPGEDGKFSGPVQWSLTWRGVD